jgi:ligand-binding sensor domain-containing protein
MKICLMLMLVFTFGAQRHAVADRWSRFLPAEDVRRIQYDGINKVYWFATDNNGLWRFDGQQFQHFTQTPDGRTIEYITAMVVDAIQNQLWVGTEAGLFCYHWLTNRWEYFDEQSGLSKNSITTLLVDRDGVLWYGSESEDRETGGGIGKKDRTGWYRYTVSEYAKWDSLAKIWVNKSGVEPIPSTPETRLARGYYDCMAQDPGGNLLFGSRGAGLCILDKTTKFWQTCFLDFPPSGIYWGQILSVAVDRQNNIWMGTLEGVCRWNRGSNRCEEFNSGLVEKTVNAIWIEADPDGDNKWFATYGGVSMLDSTNQRWKTFTNANSGLGANAIRDIIGDGDGNLWFASLQNRGVSKLNRSWTMLTTADMLSSNFVLAAAKDQFGRLWVGTDQGSVEVLSHGVWQKPLKNVSCNILPLVTAFLPDSSGMWVASQCGIFKFELSSLLSELLPSRIRKDSPAGFPSNDVRAIAVRQNTLWAGTADAGLTRVLISASGASVSATFLDELPSRKVTALAYDARGRLWVGTDKGLTIHDGGRWIPTMVGQLPASTGVSALAHDSKTDVMWVGTDSGLLRFEENQWQHFSVVDGLPDNRITVIRVASNGDVWCGTINGAAMHTGRSWVAFTTSSTDGGLSDNFISSLAFGPAGVTWLATYGGGVARYYNAKAGPETFLLENFRVVTETKVTFHYSGYDPKTDLVNLRYQYQLDDSTWHNAPPNSFTLSVAQDGLHTFAVRAIDEDGNVDASPPKAGFYKIAPEFGKPITIVEPALGQNVDSLWLYVPPAVLAEGSSMSLKSFTVAVDKKDKNKVAAPDTHLHVTDIAFQLVPEPLNASLPGNRPVTVKIFYNKTVAQNFDKRQLAIYRYEGRWLPHGGSIDAGRPVITTTITQLGAFALLANLSDNSIAKPEAGFGNLTAQPRMLSPQFAEKVTISFLLGKPAEVTAKIYNLAGRLVQRLCENLPMNSGHNALEWNGRDREDRSCPSGMYLICVQAEGRTQTKTVMVVKQ